MADRSEQPEPAPRNRRGTYAAVLAVEALVVAALWAFGTWFTR
jgi:hypothetical protein